MKCTKYETLAIWVSLFVSLTANKLFNVHAIQEVYFIGLFLNVLVKRI